MHSNISTLPSITPLKAAAPGVSPADTLREPAFETQDSGDALRLTVFVPGVTARGVEIEGRGADLTVTARKERFVRSNFSALHLESVQHDYCLRLRLGTSFDFEAMTAEIAGGVLTVTIPKVVRAEAPRRLARAA
ncbi:MAG: Hsp20/alpha crystallin family protein [Opitutaceae bacterium]|nr:Hsp20/alpha crystallin family protein [Opitutaceae bacterium]